MLVLVLGIVAQCTHEVLCVLLLQPGAVGCIAVITVNYEQRWTLHSGCCETSVQREGSCEMAAEDKVGIPTYRISFGSSNIQAFQMDQ